MTIPKIATAACIATLMLAPTTAFARSRHVDANGNLATLVASINYKLARYVHPTGKCMGGEEVLTTYYWDGARVASGGRFNPHGMTAASRTLPFGTVLNITNPHNGRQVTVTINDRGPYTNAKLDLALGAAQALGMTQSSYLCVNSGGIIEASAEPRHRQHSRRSRNRYAVAATAAAPDVAVGAH